MERNEENREVQELLKQSLLLAGYAAEQENLDLFLFGHTHIPLVDKRGKTWFLNPGSIGKGPRPTYGTIVIEDGTDFYK